MTFENAEKMITEDAKALLRACKKKTYLETEIFTPDGVGNYDALWVRDFSYMVEYCGDLLEIPEIEDCIDFIMAGQRADGWFPDRVEASGEAVYAAGAKEAPVGRANLDNTPFLVIAVSFYLKRLPLGKAQQKYKSFCEKLNRGMDCIPLAENGLVWNDPADPHSPYGFTDTVCKTGCLFMESILYWRACRLMASMEESYGDASAKQEDYAKRAHEIEKNIAVLYDTGSGMFVAADGLCRQVDIWGVLYALDVAFPFEKSQSDSAKKWLLENKNRYIYHGQVCQLVDGGAWEKLLIDVPAGEYQNGAYWATASGWALDFFRENDLAFAEKMLDELIADFEEGGICECINVGYRKLPKFVVSATNVRGGLKKM